MNQYIPELLGAMMVGAIIGILVMGMFSANRDPFSDSMGPLDSPLDRRQPVTHADSATVDFLEAGEYNLFFNPMVGESGMWAVLGSDNKLIAAGFTIRGAVERARLKQDAAAEAMVFPDPRDLEEVQS